MRTAAIKLGQKEQALLRRNAVGMRKQGMGNEAVGSALSVHPKTVALWMTRYKKEGEALFEPKTRGRKHGAKRVLLATQERGVLGVIVDKAPDQLKLPFALWTRDAVRQLIHQMYGIRLPIRTMGLYLSRWNFTPQKPLKRAYEKNERAVRRWLKTTYPEIAKQAKEEKAEIFWGDQTGVNGQPNVARGYAPRGKTPVVRQSATRRTLSLMSAVTNRGNVRFLIYPGALNAALLIIFVARLIRSAKGRKVYLILDNLRVHHSEKFQTWLKKHTHEISVFYLPSYSPELNPDEWLNRDVKGTLGRRPAPRDHKQLKYSVLGHLRSIQKSPARVRGYFESNYTAYAA